jgi:DNA-binding transcriptional regulator YhcF (GntR family)
MKAHRISIVIFVFLVLLVASPWNEVLGQRFGGHEGKGFWADMTQDQRGDVQDMIKEMKDQGATREEIRAAVVEMLEGYGIEVPEDWPGPFGPGHGRGGFWKDLTKEQREAVREMIKEMRDQSATREEIRAAVVEMLEGYGIEVPEDWPGPFGFGPGPGGFWRDLTDEQRQAVREMIREMRSQGATREEIHAAVAEMLEGYGIEQPKDPEGSASAIAPSEPDIQTQNYPNPFNLQTEISYTLPEDSHVKLTILNVQGQKVKVLVDEHQGAGTRNVIWDGCGEKGETVASGVYFYRIEAGPHDVTRRMVLLK